MDSAEGNLPGHPMISDLEISDGILQGSGFVNSKDNLSPKGGGTTMNLLQLSSQLHRVEDQRQSIHLKEQNDVFSCPRITWALQDEVQEEILETPRWVGSACISFLFSLLCWHSLYWKSTVYTTRRNYLIIFFPLVLILHEMMLFGEVFSLNSSWHQALSCARL